MTRRFTATFFAALSLLTAVMALELPGPSAQGADSTAVTVSRTIARTHLVDGHDEVVESHPFSLTVSQTTDLRGFQEVDVSWSGAHPTGGIVADPNAGNAIQQEYPVVLLECGGTDGSGADGVDPSRCWTATSSERYQESFATAFPPWRLDRYASPDERAAIVDEPDPRPTACFGRAPVERWVPFRAADGTVYAGGGSSGCGGMAPEAANVGGLSLPSNTTYGVTGPDGTGSTHFDVWTAETNASLGCSDHHACSLVAVPILGISCDAAGAGLPATDHPAGGDEADEAEALCTKTGHFAAGQVVATANNTEDLAVSGALWWSASNWRNRVTVPLQFAPAANVCDVVGTGDPVQIYGSELLTQAALQWAPHFCLDPKLFPLKHVQTAEPEARTLLASGSIEAAFGTDVPDGGWQKPVVNAPVAFTGFAIAFSIDDAEGRRVADLRLTPRLLAKLLTQSYPAIRAMKDEDPALAANPLNLTLDPEFQALNPGIAKDVPASESASTLLALSSNSDVMEALTGYITADPEARAWLDGAPDPWGMVVNTSYRGIALPVDNWPLLDSFEPTQFYDSDTNNCLHDNPVPYLAQVASPLARMADIAQHMQFSLANSQVVCAQLADGQRDGEKLVAIGRQTPGFRFMLGVVSLGDAHRFGLDVAALQTAVAPGAATAFTSADGRTFVAPTDDALRHTAALLAPDDTTKAWLVAPGAFRSDPNAADAYPGAMVVYTQVPTTGIPTAEADHLAQFLRFAVSDGQTPGFGVGQLPPGYLPLTAANGLGALADYTSAAADAVAAQSGVVPPLTVSTEQTGSGDSSGEGTGSAGGGASGLGFTGDGGPGLGAAASGPPDAAASVSPSAAAGERPDGTTNAPDSRLGGAILPALLATSAASATLALGVSVTGYSGGSLPLAGGLKAGGVVAVRRVRTFRPPRLRR